MSKSLSKPLRAWLLDWPVQPLALAQCEVVEVIEEPEVHRVPVGPSWCRALVYWRDRLLPLAAPVSASLDGLAIVVVAYQIAPRTPLEYAALAVRNMPRQIDVPENADCEPPQDGALDHARLRACFRFEDRTICVPELRELFAPADAAA